MRHLLLFLFSAHAVLAFTKSGTVYTTDGSQADVEAAIADASTGDTVNVPPGSFTWGASGNPVDVNKAITLAGAGAGSTIINISSTGPVWGTGTISISAAAIVRGLTINQPNTGPTTAISASTENGWRITEITHNSAVNVGYFVYANTYGLIDNCIVTGAGGTDELIYTRGPLDSWQTTSSMGTANAVYIEDCVFNGPGYVCDFNDNARGVVRFCTINGQMKVDGHGYASNQLRGVRHSEVYNNTWTYSSGFWTAIEIRGGTGMVFDNTAAATNEVTYFGLVEYGARTTSTQWGVYQTPFNYPIDDQVGVGMDPKSGGSEPLYAWNNTVGGSNWEPVGGFVHEDAIALYRTQIDDPEATFAMSDIIAADRDYFAHVVGGSFNGSSGVGRGTRAQMDAITPTLTGVGFWVTDEGEWNSTNGATADGRLYRWTGSAWSLHYTPYTYPHPLRGESSGGVQVTNLSVKRPNRVSRSIRISGRR